LAKEEEEEVQEDVQRDSKVVKEYMKKL